MFQKMMDKSVAKSPWLFHVNAGSCNGCDIEIVAALTPRYDAERLSFRLAGSPRQADIVVVRPHAPWQLTQDVIQSKCKWSPLEGHVFNWCVEQTYCNGHLVYDRGHFDASCQGQPILFR